MRFEVDSNNCNGTMMILPSTVDQSPAIDEKDATIATSSPSALSSSSSITSSTNSLRRIKIFTNNNNYETDSNRESPLLIYGRKKKITSSSTNISKSLNDLITSNVNNSKLSLEEKNSDKEQSRILPIFKNFKKKFINHSDVTISTATRTPTASSSSSLSLNKSIDDDNDGVGCPRRNPNSDDGRPSKSMSMNSLSSFNILFSNCVGSESESKINKTGKEDKSNEDSSNGSLLTVGHSFDPAHTERIGHTIKDDQNTVQKFHRINSESNRKNLALSVPNISISNHEKSLISSLEAKQERSLEIGQLNDEIQTTGQTKKVLEQNPVKQQLQEINEEKLINNNGTGLFRKNETPVKKTNHIRLNNNLNKNTKYPIKTNNCNTLPATVIPTAATTIRIPTADSNILLGCSTTTLSFPLQTKGLMNTIGTATILNHSLDNNNAIGGDHRYLTYGTSAQLQQEYGKFLPWPTLTEFRLRRKLRRFKRRARKLFQGNNLFGRSFHRIQNVRRLIRMAKMAKQDPEQMLNEIMNQQQQQYFNNNNDSFSNISRSSSLTSLLNLIEEANKNLLNGFEEDDLMMKSTENLTPPPPPRLKRAMSSINVGGGGCVRTNISNNRKLTQLKHDQMKERSSSVLFSSSGNLLSGDQSTINGKNQLSSIMHLKQHKQVDKSSSQDDKESLNRWTKNATADNYRIAFVEQQQQQQQQRSGVKNATSGADLSDTISVKSLDSYFNPNSSIDQQTENKLKQQQEEKERNPSKILCVRSHFQINDGTIYLEDSDWEMCSEISEPLSLTNEQQQPQPQPQAPSIEEPISNANQSIETSLVDLALNQSIIGPNYNANNSSSYGKKSPPPTTPISVIDNQLIKTTTTASVKSIMKAENDDIVPLDATHNDILMTGVSKLLENILEDKEEIEKEQERENEKCQNFRPNIIGTGEDGKKVSASASKVNTVDDDESNLLNVKGRNNNDGKFDSEVDDEKNKTKEKTQLNILVDQSEQDDLVCVSEKIRPTESNHETIIKQQNQFEPKNEGHFNVEKQEKRQPKNRKRRIKARAPAPPINQGAATTKTNQQQLGNNRKKVVEKLIQVDTQSNHEQKHQTNQLFSKRNNNSDNNEKSIKKGENISSLATIKTNESIIIDQKNIKQEQQKQKTKQNTLKRSGFKLLDKFQRNKLISTTDSTKSPKKLSKNGKTKEDDNRYDDGINKTKNPEENRSILDHSSVKLLIKQFNENETIQKMFEESKKQHQEQSNLDKNKLLSSITTADNNGTNFENICSIFSNVSLMKNSLNDDMNKDNINTMNDSYIFIENLIRRIVNEQQQQQSDILNCSNPKIMMIEQSTNNMLLMLLILQYQQQQQQQCQQQQLNELRLLQTLQNKINENQINYGKSIGTDPQQQQQLNPDNNNESNILKSKEMEFEKLLKEVQKLLKQCKNSSDEFVIPEPEIIQQETELSTIINQQEKQGNKKSESKQKSDEKGKENRPENITEINQTTNSKCSNSNRFVNKIVLNNSINQFNFNVKSNDPNGSSNNELSIMGSKEANNIAVPQIVNVLNDNSCQQVLNQNDLSSIQQSANIITNNNNNNNTNNTNERKKTQQGENEEKKEQKTNDKKENLPSIKEEEEEIGIGTNKSDKLKLTLKPSEPKHRTVLELKSNSCQSKFSLIHTLRYQIEKKRNKSRMERLRREKEKKINQLDQLLLQSTLSLTTLHEENYEQHQQDNKTMVTLANTSNIEIRSISQQSKLNNNAKNNSKKQHQAKTGTLRRLLFASSALDGDTKTDASNSNNKKNNNGIGNKNNKITNKKSDNNINGKEKKQKKNRNNTTIEDNNNSNKNNEENNANSNIEKKFMDISEPYPLGIESMMIGSMMALNANNDNNNNSNKIQRRKSCSYGTSYNLILPKTKSQLNSKEKKSYQQPTTKTKRIPVVAPLLPSSSSSSSSSAVIIPRCFSERNFRSIIKLNESVDQNENEYEDEDDDDEENYVDVNNQQQEQVEYDDDFSFEEEEEEENLEDFKDEVVSLIDMVEEDFYGYQTKKQKDQQQRSSRIGPTPRARMASMLSGSTNNHINIKNDHYRRLADHGNNNPKFRFGSEINLQQRQAKNNSNDNFTSTICSSTTSISSSNNSNTFQSLNGAVSRMRLLNGRILQQKMNKGIVRNNGKSNNNNNNPHHHDHNSLPSSRQPVVTFTLPRSFKPSSSSSSLNLSRKLVGRNNFNYNYHQPGPNRIRPRRYLNYYGNNDNNNNNTNNDDDDEDELDNNLKHDPNFDDYDVDVDVDDDDDDDADRAKIFTDHKTNFDDNFEEEEEEEEYDVDDDGDGQNDYNYVYPLDLLSSKSKLNERYFRNNDDDYHHRHHNHQHHQNYYHHHHQHRN